MRSLTLPWAPEPKETLSAPLLPAPCTLSSPQPGPPSLSTRACVFHVTEETTSLTVLTSQHVDLSTPTALVHRPPLACPLDLFPSLLLK